MKKGLPKKQSVNYFDPETVLYLTGDANYSRIHLANETIVLSARTLKWFAQQWPTFLRPHKQVLVNPAYIHRLQVGPTLRATSYIIMQNKAQLPISRRRVSGMIFNLGNCRP